MNIQLLSLFECLASVVFQGHLDADLVNHSHLASDLVVSVGSKGQDQRGVLRELRMSLACINSDGTGYSGVKLSEGLKVLTPKAEMSGWK